MSCRWFVIGIFSFVLVLAACTDSTTPPFEENEGPDDPLFTLPDSIPHDFVITTEPTPVLPGEGATVSARWSDSNLNATAVLMTLEGARIIGDQILTRSEKLQQYECRQWMVMPDTFRTNLVQVRVSDPDSQVTHVHGIDIEGGWPPPNNPPREVSVSFQPYTIGAGQTVSLTLAGKDDENNMVPGITARYAGGQEIQALEGTIGFTMEPATNDFAYSFAFIAPPDTGSNVVELTVQDFLGETHSYSGSFQVGGSNRPPYFTGTWLEDRVVMGQSDRLDFRVAAMDPNGDDLFLLYKTNFGSLDVDILGESHGDTTVWTGTFIPSFADTAHLTFSVYDQTVVVAGASYTILVDHSGRPVLDQLFITDGTGERRQYDPNGYVVVLGERGEEKKLELLAHDPLGENLEFAWSRSFEGKGAPTKGQASDFTFTVPDAPGITTVQCTVSDPEGYQVRPRSIEIFVE